MKAKSIIALEAILKQRKEAEHKAYKNIRYNLEQKYGTEWLDNTITQSEKNMLYGQKQLYEEAAELYEDFISHNW